MQLILEMEMFFIKDLLKLTIISLAVKFLMAFFDCLTCHVW